MDMSFLKQRLKGEYREVYEQIECYSTTVQTVDTKTIEEQMMNLLDSLFVAQEEAVSTERIVGKDIGKFCRDYFQCLDKKAYFLEIAQRIYYFSCVIFVWGVLTFIFEMSDQKSIWEITSNVMPFLLAIGVKMVLDFSYVVFLRTIIMKRQKGVATTNPSVVSIITGVILVVSYIFIMHYEISVQLLPQLLLWGSYCVGYMVFDKVRQHRQDGSDSRAIYEELEQEYKNRERMKIYAEASRKRYRRINEKRKRRKRELINEKQFTEKIQNECKVSRIVGVLIHVFSAVLFFGVALEAAVSSPMDKFMTFLFWFVLMTILFLIWSKFAKIMLSMEHVETLLEECRQKGITLLQYEKGNE